MVTAIKTPSPCPIHLPDAYEGSQTCRDNFVRWIAFYCDFPGSGEIAPKTEIKKERK